MKKCLQKHRGARNELIACAWLLGEGYEVFRNISQHGDVDLIGMRDSQITFFDVKAALYRTDGKPSPHNNRLSEAQILAGVKCLNVYPDGACAIVDNATSRETAREPRSCIQCGAKFKPSNAKHSFCSPKCCKIVFNARSEGAYPPLFLQKREA